MIREAILKTLKDQSISQRKCAIDCKIDPADLNGFLKGRKELSREKTESVMEYLNLEIRLKELF